MDAIGHQWRFAYVGHLLTRETDRAGFSFYFAYDGGRYTVTSVMVPERFFDKSIHHVTVDGGIRTAHIGEWLEFDLIRISKKNGVTVHNHSCP